MGRETILDGQLWKVAARPLAARLVDRNPRRDREHPGAEVPSVAELRIGAERPQEGLLERIFGALSEQPPQVGEDRVLVVGVERFERRDAHRLHLVLKRSSASSCEVVVRKGCQVGISGLKWAAVDHVAR